MTEKVNYLRHLALMNTIFRAWEEGLKTIRFLGKNGENSVPGWVVAVSVMKEIEIKLYREVTIIIAQYDRVGPL